MNLLAESRFSKHFFERMKQRGISADEVAACLTTKPRPHGSDGEIFEFNGVKVVRAVKSRVLLTCMRDAKMVRKLEAAKKRKYLRQLAREERSWKS